jgi:hypothetical protein
MKIELIGYICEQDHAFWIVFKDGIHPLFCPQCGAKIKDRIPLGWKTEPDDQD